MICLITWCSTRRLLICQTSYENFCMSPQRYLQRSLNDHDELLIVRYGHDLWEKKKSFWEIPASMSSLSFQSSWSSLSSNYASKRAMTESVDFLVAMTYSKSFLLLRPLLSSGSFSFFLLKDHVIFHLFYLPQPLFFMFFTFSCSVSLSLSPVSSFLFLFPYALLSVIISWDAWLLRPFFTNTSLPSHHFMSVNCGRPQSSLTYWRLRSNASNFASFRASTGTYYS